MRDQGMPLRSLVTASQDLSHGPTAPGSARDTAPRAPSCPDRPDHHQVGVGQAGHDLAWLAAHHVGPDRDGWFESVCQFYSGVQLAMIVLVTPATLPW
jgi:hypothetical protein